MTHGYRGRVVDVHECILFVCTIYGGQRGVICPYSMSILVCYKGLVWAMCFTWVVGCGGLLAPNLARLLAVL